MRLVFLASVAALTVSSAVWAQGVDRDQDIRGMSPRNGATESGRKGAGGDSIRPESNEPKRGDRAEKGGGDRDMGDRSMPREGSRADKDEMRRDRVRDDERGIDQGLRERKKVLGEDGTLREHSVREGHELDRTSTRRHVSINANRRTHYRDVFVKTYKERPQEGFDVRVGARLPEKVIVERVPDSYYVEEPDLRGLSYFVDRGHAYLVDPDSREVIEDLD